MKFEVDVDNAELLAALDTLGDAAKPYMDRAAYVTANRVVLEAKARVRRRTGETQRGIVVEESFLGGYVVVSGNDRMPTLPHWIEKGTKFQDPRPYFDPSVELERSAHNERVADAIEQAIREKGLGG